MGLTVSDHWEQGNSERMEAKGVLQQAETRMDGAGPGTSGPGTSSETQTAVENPLALAGAVLERGTESPLA